MPPSWRGPATLVALLVLLLGGGALHRFMQGDREALVLEPNDRATAVRLGTLDEDPEPLDRPPTLPEVPTLAPGTSLTHARTGTVGAAEAGDDLSAEMRLLSEARRNLEEDPAAALTLLDQHRDRYPAGALREEREAYAILCLRRLSRTSDAERRLVDFADDFPASNFGPLLRGE